MNPERGPACALGPVGRERKQGGPGLRKGPWHRGKAPGGPRLLKQDRVEAL